MLKYWMRISEQELTSVGFPAMPAKEKGSSIDMSRTWIARLGLVAVLAMILMSLSVPALAEETAAEETATETEAPRATSPRSSQNILKPNTT